MKVIDWDLYTIPPAHFRHDQPTGWVNTPCLLLLHCEITEKHYTSSKSLSFEVSHEELLRLQFNVHRAMDDFEGYLERAHPAAEGKKVGTPALNDLMIATVSAWDASLRSEKVDDDSGFRLRISGKQGPQRKQFEVSLDRGQLFQLASCIRLWLAPGISISD